MEQYAGIDVSLELSSVCIVDAQGKIVKEAKVERTGSFSWLFRDAWLCSEADRAGGRTIVAVAACGVETSRIRRGSAGNAACEGSVIGDDGEDGSQGCTRDCPVDPDGMVPPSARKVDRSPRDSGAAGCALSVVR